MANQKQQQYIWLPTLLALLFIVGVLVGTALDSNSPILSVHQNAHALSDLGHGKIEEILRYVDAKYVDGVEHKALMTEAIESVMEDLDPHSNYISAEDLQNVNEQLAGNFEGIGLEFMILDDTLVVVTPVTEGPAEQAGVLAGDKIISIQDSIISGVGMKVGDISKQFKGKKGTQVEIEILRRGLDEPQKLTITRDEIPINSIEAAYTIEEGIGYMKISRFSASTYEEFMRHLERLVEKEGVEDLIIDLRHNPGGYLQQATNILSQLFEEKDQLLVYTEGRTVKRTEYKTSGRNFFSIDDVAIIIDEGAASASEIVAGAIQDLDRGVIVGRRSFGKGLVQEQYNLHDGSALRLTVARYYTPSGRSIQRAYDDMNGYDNEFMERYEHGEFTNQDSVTIIDSLQFRTSKGRLVYGGGGIAPDIFVPMNTIYFDDDFIAYQNKVAPFVFRYIEQYPSVFDKDNIQISDVVFDDFIAYAASKGITTDTTQVNAFRPELYRLLEARIAKQLSGNDGYYEVWNRRDPSILKALEALQSTDPLKLRALK